MPSTSPIELVLELTALHTQLAKRLEHQLSIHGISFTELLLLHQLHSAPRQTLRRIDLAENIGLTASGVTRMLKPMEKIGLVEKELNPRDARVSLVKLSKTGRRLYRDAFASCSDAAELLTSPLNAKQRASLLGMIRTLRQPRL